MKLSLKSILIIVLAGMIAALTLIIRIPTPATGGYINLGDMGVIFAGLFLRRFSGALAGAIGSAVADIIGGFFIFAPITFIAKGLEGYIAGTLGLKNPAWLILSVLSMTSIYFVAELFLPNMGWSSALSSLPFNIVQATIGAIGGYIIFKGVGLGFPKLKN